MKIIVCALYSLTLLFSATEMTQYWFQSKLLSKYPSIAALAVYIVVAVYSGRRYAEPARTRSVLSRGQG